MNIYIYIHIYIYISFPCIDAKAPHWLFGFFPSPGTCRPMQKMPPGDLAREITKKMMENPVTMKIMKDPTKSVYRKSLWKCMKMDEHGWKCMKSMAENGWKSSSKIGRFHQGRAGWIQTPHFHLCKVDDHLCRLWRSADRLTMMNTTYTLKPQIFPELHPPGRGSMGYDPQISGENLQELNLRFMATFSGNGIRSSWTVIIP